MYAKSKVSPSKLHAVPDDYFESLDIEYDDRDECKALVPGALGWWQQGKTWYLKKGHEDDLSIFREFIEKKKTQSQGSKKSARVDQAYFQYPKFLCDKFAESKLKKVCDDLAKNFLSRNVGVKEVSQLSLEAGHAEFRKFQDEITSDLLKSYFCCNEFLDCKTIFLQHFQTMVSNSFMFNNDSTVDPSKVQMEKKEEEFAELKRNYELLAQELKRVSDSKESVKSGDSSSVQLKEVVVVDAAKKVETAKSGESPSKKTKQ